MGGEVFFFLTSFFWKVFGVVGVCGIVVSVLGVISVCYRDELFVLVLILFIRGYLFFGRRNVYLNVLVRVRIC